MGGAIGVRLSGGGSLSQIDKPNWTAPLAASFNTRGIQGYTAVVTNSQDQIKINSVYDVVQNIATGKSTLYLRKRPGFQSSAITGGSAAHIPYLALETPTTSNSVGVILDDGTNIKYYYDATNVTIRTNAKKPRYADTTVISGTNTAVVQFGDVVNANVYYSTGGAWTQISDADFTALAPRGKMEHMDGYAFLMDSTNKVYNSDLNSISAWTATSYVTKSILQDEPTGLARLGRVILAFGKETVEGFYNAGNTSGSPLGRIPQISERIGLYIDDLLVSDGRHYSAVVGRVLYFIGTENKYGGNTKTPGIFAFDGSSFKRISGAVDKIIYQGGPNSDIKHICAFPIASIGVCVAVLLTTTSATTQRWLVYEPKTGEWFLWTSASTQPVNDSGQFIGIGGVTGDKTFQYSTTAWQDNGVAYTMTHQFKLPQSGSHRKRMPMFGVVGDTQTGTSNLGVEFSDDDYATFSAVRNIDLTKAKKNIYRCGSFTGRAVRLTHSDNTDCRLELAVARIED